MSKNLAYVVRDGGLWWSKTSPTSAEGMSPPGEPFFAARVEYSPSKRTWINLRADGAYLAGGPSPSFEDAVARADSSFKNYKAAASPHVDRLEAEIDSLFAAILPLDVDS